MPNLAPDPTAPPAPARPPERPAATVVVPTLNEERTLGAVLGPLRQSARRLGLELVVSDGGSTDGTVTLALGLADRVVVHRGAERQTIAAGRNAGAGGAASDVLLFFNADVRFPQDLDGFLRDLIEAAQEAGAATCRVAVHPDEARLADRVVLGTCNALFLALNGVGVGMGRGECHALRRDVFEAVGGYDERLVAGEDFELFTRVLRAGRRSRRDGAVGFGVRFLWRHVLYEDPRRYRRRGYARTMADWFLNSASVYFRGRSFSREWTAIR